MCAEDIKVLKRSEAVLFSEMKSSHFAGLFIALFLQCLDVFICLVLIGFDRERELTVPGIGEYSVLMAFRSFRGASSVVEMGYRSWYIG
jgi:hypothetical protein